MTKTLTIKPNESVKFDRFIDGSCTIEVSDSVIERMLKGEKININTKKNDRYNKYFIPSSNCLSNYFTATPDSDIEKGEFIDICKEKFLFTKYDMYDYIYENTFRNEEECKKHSNHVIERIKKDYLKQKILMEIMRMYQKKVKAGEKINLSTSKWITEYFIKRIGKSHDETVYYYTIELGYYKNSNFNTYCKCNIAKHYLKNKGSIFACDDVILKGLANKNIYFSKKEAMHSQEYRILKKIKK